MLHALMDRDKWSLCLGDEVLVQHSQDQPFVTMIRLEKRYSANRGSVKTTVEETDRVPLTEAEPLPGAEEAGARGGTIIHGRGTANREAEKLFQIVIQPDKEIVMIVVRSEIKDDVLKAVNEKAGLDTAGQGIAFSLPVDKAVGIS